MYSRSNICQTEHSHMQITHNRMQHITVKTIIRPIVLPTCTPLCSTTNRHRIVTTELVNTTPQLSNNKHKIMPLNRNPISNSTTNSQTSHWPLRPAFQTSRTSIKLLPIRTAVIVAIVITIITLTTTMTRTTTVPMVLQIMILIL